MVQSLDARNGFRNAVNRLKRKKVNLQGAILAQSYLWFEAELDANRTQYNFPVILTQKSSTGGEQSVYEQRLQLQDVFFTSHVGYFIRIVTSAGYTGLAPWLQTFPSVSTGGSLDLDYQKRMWSGSLSLTIDQRNICPFWDLQRNFYVPQTQRPMARTSDWMYNDQQDGSMDGFYPAEPNWVLSGMKNIELNVNLNQSIGTYPDGAYKTGVPVSARAVVILRGVLAQNVAKQFS